MSQLNRSKISDQDPLDPLNQQSLLKNDLLTDGESNQERKPPSKFSMQNALDLDAAILGISIEEDLKSDIVLTGSSSEDKHGESKQDETSSNNQKLVHDVQNHNQNQSEHFPPSVDQSPPQERSTNFVSPSNRTTISNQDDRDGVPLIQGEGNVMHLTDAILHWPTGNDIPGILDMTTYRIIYTPDSNLMSQLALFNPTIKSMLTYPLSAIERVERERKTKDSHTATLLISTKDGRAMRVTLHSPAIDKIINALLTYIFPNEVRNLFAFTHSLPDPIRTHNCFFNLPLEFERQGVLDDRADGSPSFWRFASINETYGICKNYPSLLVAPSSVSDDELLQSAAFRSEGRLPALSWASKVDAASIWRSSQPKVGMSHSSPADERLLEEIAKAGSGKKSNKVIPTLLHIVDCRPKANAMANRATGQGGYESGTNYKHCRITFMDIPNIHAMRESVQRVHALFLSVSVDDVNWSSQVEETKWLSHIRLVLRASRQVAFAVHRERCKVLVHCSHGWDRTSQVL